MPQGKHFTSLVGGIFHRSYIYKNASKRFLDIVEAISSIFAEDCKCFFGEIRSFVKYLWCEILLCKCEIRLRRVENEVEKQLSDLQKTLNVSAIKVGVVNIKITKPVKVNHRLWRARFFDYKTKEEMFAQICLISTFALKSN